MAQLEEFDSGGVFINKTESSGNFIRRLPISRTTDSDKQAAVRASSKLDASDVKGAIRVLSSVDTFVTLYLASCNTLLSNIQWCR